MSSELRSQAEVGNENLSPFPPSSAFTLRRVENKDYSSETDLMRPDSLMDIDEAEFNMYLKRRPWILNNRITQNHGAIDRTQLDTDPSSKICLPKDVIGGCSSCSDCHGVTERCYEGDALTELEEVPVFRPTEEEFKDVLKYISSVYPQAKKYGICRIVPPSSWQPPCLLQEKNKWDCSTFMTHVQHIHELWRHHRHSKRKMRPTSEKEDEKRRKGLGMNMEANDAEGCCNTDSVEVETDREFTLATFKRHADDFKNQYFSSMEKTNIKDGLDSEKEHLEPTLENIEREYNRIIESPIEKIEVLYGADIDTTVFGSGFPKIEESEWNLNNVSKLPDSILCFGSPENSSILTPKLCIGMCFSSVYWNIAEHHLYTLSYMHLGSPRIWYGSPGIHSLEFESALKENSFNLKLWNLESFHKSVQAIQIPPSMFKSQGIPVYRCVQNPGEFVCILPGSFHASFDCGFNCSEKAYFAPIDWIPHGLLAAEVYHDQRRKTMISFDKLLLSVASKAVRATWENFLMGKNSEDNGRWLSICKDGLLTKVVKSRVHHESAMRNHFLTKSSKSIKMNLYFDSTTTSPQKMDCSICCYNLHFSAVFCLSCSPQLSKNNRYACLRHANELCPCPCSTRQLLFRHSTEDLNLLVDALEGKVSAAHKWGKKCLD